jgi:ABC-type uncharacterized transport system permease subunit
MDFLSIDVLSNIITKALSEVKSDEVIFTVSLLTMIGLSVCLVFVSRRKR